MRLAAGHGGWVGVDGLGLAGPLFVRVKQTERRLEICEFYLDYSAGRDAVIRQSDLRQLPLSNIEAAINDLIATSVVAKIDLPGPNLSVLASYYGTWFGSLDPDNLNWVALSLVDDPSIPEADGFPHIVQVKRQRPERWRTAERDYRLDGGPTEGLTDDFLRSVAKAYGAAVTRGERPNVSIADQTGYPVASVRRWVYTARQRGVMSRGRQGASG